MGEDAALLFTITPNIESLFITDLAGYFYRQRPGSILGRQLIVMRSKPKGYLRYIVSFSSPFQNIQVVSVI